jgi:hypothetical protein
MSKPRRQFLWAAGAALSGLICGANGGAQAPRRGMPIPPEPSDPKQNKSESSSAKISRGAILQQHEKAFRESLAALSDRVNQLKQEVEALHSKDVFSVRIYKQTNDIERLAKQLKSLAKG